jgi:hypothetical protein
MKIELLKKYLNKQERRSLLLNFAQILSMVSFAFGIPIVIGIEAYGLYVACFALPATLSVLVQSYLISTATVKKHENILYYFLILYVIFAIFIYIVYGLVLGSVERLYAVVIFSSLMLRLLFEVALLRSDSKFYLSVLFKSEVAIAINSFLFIILLWSIEWKSVILPISILCINSIIVVYFIYPKIEKSKWVLFNGSMDQIKIKSLFKGFSLRLHEECFVTNMPLILAYTVGNELAGQFRICLSIAKAMAKILPYRFEVVLFEFVNGTFEKKHVLRNLFFISLSYLTISIFGLTVSYLIGGYHYNVAFILMFLFGPFLAFLLIFMPLAVKLDYHNIWYILFFFVVCAVSALSQNLIIISLAFISCQGILSFLAVRVIFFSNRNLKLE